MQATAARLVEEFATFTRTAAWRVSYLAPPSVGVDDLMQEGRLALVQHASAIEAVEGEPHRSSYAKVRVRGAMLDYIRKQYGTRGVEKRLVSLGNVEDDDGTAFDNRLSPDDPYEYAAVEQVFEHVDRVPRIAQLFWLLLMGNSMAEAATAMRVSGFTARAIKKELLDFVYKHCG